jgi:hypothetical protein
MLPNYYQYVVRLAAEEDCPICMEGLNREGVAGVGESLLEREVMRTPCGHVFHPECLRAWMDVRLECPACRASIPAEM